MKNIHYYVQDPETGIIYRTVGFTSQEELIIYPKYIPDFDGTRGEKLIKYKGINYPNGSVKFLASGGTFQSSIVKIKFNAIFNTFVPMARKKDLVLYDPFIRLNERLRQDSDSSIQLRDLVLFLANNSGVDIVFFGLDASMLAEMDKDVSDIDLVVYGKENGWKVRKLWENVLSKGGAGFSRPEDTTNATIQRRQAYSPLMTEEEIFLWEKCKISGYFKGKKFSVMPVDQDGNYKTTYYPTGQMAGIRVEIKKDEVVCDPGIINLENHSVDIIYGPKNIMIEEYITFLPSRMGIFLKKGEKLFIVGKLYTLEKLNKTYKFALTQFPWDDNSHLGESYFVTKKEKCNLQHMIPSLLGLKFNNNYFIDNENN